MNDKKDWGIGIPKYSQDDIMTKEDINSFGLETIINFVIKDDYKIIGLNQNQNPLSYIMAEKGGKSYCIFVVTDIAPKHPELSIVDNEYILIKSHEYNFIPLFAAVSFGSTDSERFKRSIALKEESYYCNFTGFQMVKDNVAKMEKGEKIVVIKSSNENIIEVYAHGTYLGLDKDTSDEMLALDIVVNNSPMTIIMKMDSFDYVAAENWLWILKIKFPHAIVEENLLGKQFESDLNK